MYTATERGCDSRGPSGTEVVGTSTRARLQSVTRVWRPPPSFLRRDVQPTGRYEQLRHKRWKQERQSQHRTLEGGPATWEEGRGRGALRGEGAGGTGVAFQTEGASNAV